MAGASHRVVSGGVRRVGSEREGKKRSGVVVEKEVEGSARRRRDSPPSSAQQRETRGREYEAGRRRNREFGGKGVAVEPFPHVAPVSSLRIAEESPGHGLLIESAYNFKLQNKSSIFVSSCL